MNTIVGLIVKVHTNGDTPNDFVFEATSNGIGVLQSAHEVRLIVRCERSPDGKSVPCVAAWTIDGKAQPPHPVFVDELQHHSDACARESAGEAAEALAERFLSLIANDQFDDSE